MSENRTIIQSRMNRRAAAHDYALPGIYHITLRVADEQAQPFGRVVGDTGAPAGSADAPRVALSSIGQMVEYELLHSIQQRYPMMEVQDFVIMPEHIHFIIEAHDTIISKAGKKATLGQVIAGFKKGCNRRFWQLTGQEILHQGKPEAANISASEVGVPASVVGAPAVSPQVSPSASYKVPSAASSGRAPLFAYGYTDVMPLRKGQLAQQREYIRNNPRTRLLRNSNRAWLYTQRGGVATALTPSALHGYLRRKCGAALATHEAWEELAAQLLMAPDGTITCDTFGNRRLLSRRLLPVVCHRKDVMRFEEQKTRCLSEAAHGAVLTSARIAKGEQAIIDEAVSRGFPAVIVSENGFPDRYHPSAIRLSQCATGNLILVTPWQYRYRHADESIHVPRCKTMNCVAQALCRTKDSWWQ